ncbi:MAG TPA: hypothetical protein VFU02_01430, partial [Polyangiaceae bacterium]|nr:hypothetical protein [Polyangiaceae bacterium]
MTRFTVLRVFSAVVLVAGLAALPSAHSASTDASAAIFDDDLGPERDQPSTRERALATGDSMVLDVSALVPLLDSLRVEEREEQIADWAVYGTLFNAPGNAEELREAIYDKVPLRI